MNNSKITTTIFSCLIFFHNTILPLQKTFQKTTQKITHLSAPRKPIYKTQKRNMTGAEVLAALFSAKVLNAAAVTGTVAVCAWWKKSSDTISPLQTAEIIAKNQEAIAKSQEAAIAAKAAQEVAKQQNLNIPNVASQKPIVLNAPLREEVKSKFTWGIHAISQNNNNNFYVTQQEKLAYEAQEALIKAYQDQLYQAAIAAQDSVDPQLRSTVQSLANYLSLESFSERLGIDLEKAKELQKLLQIEAVNKAINSIEKLDATLLRLLINGQMAISDSPEAKKVLGKLALKVTTEEWAKIFERTSFKSFHEHQSYVKKGLHWLGQKIPVSKKYFDDLVSASKSGNMDDILDARKELQRVYVPIAGEKYNDVQKHAQAALGITPVQASASLAPVAGAGAQSSIGVEKIENPKVASFVETSLPEQPQSISHVWRQNISGAVNKAATETFSAPSLILTTLFVRARSNASNPKEFGIELGAQLTKNMATNLTAQGITAGSQVAFINLGGPAAIGAAKALMIKIGLGWILVTTPAWIGPVATMGSTACVFYMSSGLVNNCWNSTASALNAKATQAAIQKEAKRLSDQALKQAEEFKIKWLAEQAERKVLEERLKEEASKSLFQRATETVANNKVKTVIGATTVTAIGYATYNSWQKSRNNNNVNLPHNYSEATTGGPQDPKNIKKEVEKAAKRIYEANQKHHKNVKGNISPEPLFPQESLKVAMEIPGADGALVSISKCGKLIDIFPVTRPVSATQAGIWHGFSVAASDLLKSPLGRKAFDVLRKQELVTSQGSPKLIKEAVLNWIKKYYV